ncbi:hypothetical protein P692DRAFT_20882339 [Suillus brevipes Sb2]|nr:hypothetical protein P692DRAFT_20882339 [Suillus brevipes Sb2]
MKDIINARQLDISCILDELTTILKYKDLEAAQAEGISFSFLPRSTAVPNGMLLCNGKSARDRNRKVAPMIISEKFGDWTCSNTLYVEQLFILNWPAGVPPPGPDFDLKALSASQLRALVVPYLRMHLGAMYEVDLGQDDEDDDSEAETAKTKKRKGKSKKSNDNRRTKGTIVEEPDIVLSIREWSEFDVEHLESQSPSMYSIPLVIDMNGEVLRELWDSVKFFKDFPLPDQASTKQVTEELPSSDQEASRPTQVAPHSNHRALRSNHNARQSRQDASCLPQPTHWELRQGLPPSSPPLTLSTIVSSSSPGSTILVSSYACDSVRPPTSRYEHSQYERPRYEDTRKRTRDNYETAREAGDLENETIVERYHARLQGNNRRIPSGHPQSHPPPPIASTSRSQLPARSSHAPVSRRSGSSLRRHHPRA